MKLVTYQVGQKVRVGVLSADEEWVFPIESIGPEYKTMLEAVKQMSESEKQLLEYSSMAGTRIGFTGGQAGRGEAAGADSCTRAGYHLSGNQLYGACGRVCPF